MVAVAYRRDLFILVFMMALFLSPRLATASFLKTHSPQSFRHFMTSSDVISSTKSNTCKTIQSLLKKRKKRIEMGATVVEGPRMIIDLLSNVKTKHLVRQVIISTEKPEWTRQVLEFNLPDLLIQEATPQVLEKCSDTVTPQGIVAIVDMPENKEPLQRKYPLHLILDGVSDPGNVGTLLRSSVAVGVSSVVLLKEACDVWNPKAVRSAMGCTFQLSIFQVDSWHEAEALLREKWGVSNIYAATMASGDIASMAHFDVVWTLEPSALIIGGEGNGLSKPIQEAVTSGDIRATHVPMEAGIESLNAAVCGSVIMFEYLRQCQTRERKR